MDNQFKVVDDLLRCGVAGVDMHIIGGIDDVLFGGLEQREMLCDGLRMLLAIAPCTHEVKPDLYAIAVGPADAQIRCRGWFLVAYESNLGKKCVMCLCTSNPIAITELVVAVGVINEKWVNSFHSV